MSEILTHVNGDSRSQASASGIVVHCAYDNIVELVDLVPNPRNPNKHSDKQIALLSKIIKHQGWRAPIVISKRSGFVVTGHGRLMAAKLLATETVPVNYQEFKNEADEYAHLIADNKIAELAELDSTGVKTILDDLEKWKFPDLSLTGFSEKEIAKLSKEVDKAIETTELDKIGELTGVKSLKPNALFPSKCKYDIPEIRRDMIMSCPSNLKCWAGPDAVNVMESTTWLYNWGTDSKRGLDLEKTIIGFYTDDYRFENFWYVPDDYVGRLINSKVLGALSPNFSLWAEHPLAIKIFNTYRSRWVGRYMQEAGIKVIPDICGVLMEANWDFCLEGIPRDSPCVSIQVQTGIKDPIHIGGIRRGLKHMIDVLVPNQLLLYVGETWEEVLDMDNFPKSLELIIVRNRLQERTAVMKSANKTLKGN